MTDAVGRSAPADTSRAPRGGVPATADALVAAALGALHSVSFVLTAAWPLQLLGVALLVARVAAAGSARRAALLGLAFGTGWLGAGTWWLFVSLHRYGGLPAWMAVVAVAALAALLSLYLAVATGLFARLRRGRPLADALLFAALWLLAELAREVLFTGFPWVASGYAHVDGPLAALAPWTGVLGLGAVAAALAAWVALASLEGPRRGAGALVGVAALLGGCVLFGGHDFSRPSGRISVTLLQSNVPQNEKFVAEAMPDALRWTREQLLGARTDLVVGPETVIPLLPEQLDPGYWESLVDHFQRGAQAALFGVPLGDPAVGFTNSAVGVSAATKALPGGVYRYDKEHLVPFGEFIPTGFHWFTAMMNIPLGDFNRGPVVAPSFTVRGERIGANICYEDLFGEALAARFAQPAAAPTVFANLSNIGWFGDTIAIDQHLQISRMRTLELQRPMIRATNTGATAVIDHRGRVTASLPRFARDVLEAQVEGRTGLTPFARWASALSLWPLFGAALAVLAVVASTSRPGRARFGR